MSEPRYKVVEESTTGHCCFDFTVVDTHIPGVYSEDDGDHVCETFEKGLAERIADALNTLASIEHPTPTEEYVDLEDWRAEVEKQAREERIEAMSPYAEAIDVICADLSQLTATCRFRGSETVPVDPPIKGEAAEKVRAIYRRLCEVMHEMEGNPPTHPTEGKTDD